MIPRVVHRLPYNRFTIYSRPTPRPLRVFLRRPLSTASEHHVPLTIGQKFKNGVTDVSQVVLVILIFQCILSQLPSWDTLLDTACRVVPLKTVTDDRPEEEDFIKNPTQQQPIVY